MELTEVDDSMTDDAVKVVDNLVNPTLSEPPVAAQDIFISSCCGNLTTTHPQVYVFNVSNFYALRKN